MDAKPVVLIVEDDFLVRIFADEIAVEAGFNTLAAADADEAIRILQNRTDVRVVLTDITLPGYSDGLELAHAIQHRWPSIQVVLTSGVMRPTANELPEHSRFVPIPCDFSGLTGLLRGIGG